MTTWVLLRGLMRESRHWGEFLPLLHEKLSEQGEHTIITLDLPGNGSLYQQTSLISITLMANYCHEQMARHPPPYSVLALSLGAMVAVEWARQYPAEIEKLVLINTSLAPYNPFYHRLRPGNYAALFLRLARSTAWQREELILRLTSAKDRSRLLPEWAQYAEQYPISRKNIVRQLVAAMRYRAEKPQVPLLLLAGEKDKLVNVKCSLTLARLWGCEIRLHPMAGHDLPLDDPAWVAQQIA
jgi:pimeloyl-ACP methyl ester carboxylesterase